MPQTKVDYPQLEREYIVAEERPSLRAIAKREGLSNSTISDYARKNDWDGKRASYQRRLLDEFIDTTAVKNAKRLARLSELTVDVLEGSLARFGEELTQHLDDDGNPNGKEPIFVSPKDALDTIRVIRELAAFSGRSAEEKSDSPNITVNLGSDLIAAIGDLARGSLLAGRTPAARPIALPGGAESGSGRVEEAESA